MFKPFTVSTSQIDYIVKQDRQIIDELKQKVMNMLDSQQIVPLGEYYVDYQSLVSKDGVYECGFGVEHTVEFKVMPLQPTNDELEDQYEWFLERKFAQ